MKNVTTMIWNQFKSKPESIAVQTMKFVYLYSDLEILVKKYMTKICSVTNKQKCIIGLYLSRSIHYIASMIAVLACGCSFLPLDKKMPFDRLQKIIKTCNVKIIIADTDVVFNENLAITTITVSDVLSIESIVEEAPYIQSIESKDLAYVIFTSGSTGFPKGVLISHYALFHFCNVFVNAITMKEYQSILALANTAFDMSIVDMLVSLTIGMRIILVTDQDLLHPRNIINIINKLKPDIIHLTPSHLIYLKAYQREFNWVSKVRLIILGGEKVNQSHLELLKAYSGVRIFNGYGPTEATVCFSIGELTHDDGIHVGKPLEGMKFKIVDDKFQECTVGELLLTGPCLSLGYINNIVQTREKFRFVRNNLYYCTGDIATIDKNNNLIIYGRSDNQVKIAGHRVELEDIEENIIKNIPHIVQCIVIYKEKVLNCYYKSSCSININDTYIKLKALLPSYMIPSVFTKIQNFSLTPNGKIDRKIFIE